MIVGYCDNQILFTNAKNEYAVSSATIENELNSAAELTFTLPPMNTHSNMIVPRGSSISVERDGRQIFKGSVISTETDFMGNVQCVAYDLISGLGDVFKAPFSVEGQTVPTYLGGLLSEYNDTKPSSKRVRIGDCDITGLCNFSYGEYTTYFDLLKDLISEKGGYIRQRYESGIMFLDYLQSNSLASSQEIVFGQNLVDITDQIDTDTLVSRVIPIGKEGLTIASVNGGSVYLINSGVEALYGRKEQVVNVDSDDPNVVKSYGQAYLTRYAAEKNTIELTAVDLSRLNKRMNEFSIGDAVRVVSPPHGIDAYMPINAITIDLISDSNSKITLGLKRNTMTGQTSAIGDAVKALEETVGTAYTVGSWRVQKLSTGYAIATCIQAINGAEVTKDYGAGFRSLAYAAPNYPPDLWALKPAVSASFHTDSGTTAQWATADSGETDPLVSPELFFLIRNTAGTVYGYVHYIAIGLYK